MTKRNHNPATRIFTGSWKPAYYVVPKANRESKKRKIKSSGGKAIRTRTFDETAHWFKMKLIKPHDDFIAELHRLLRTFSGVDQQYEVEKLIAEFINNYSRDVGEMHDPDARTMLREGSSDRLKLPDDMQMIRAYYTAICHMFDWIALHDVWNHGTQYKDSFMASIRRAKNEMAHVINAIFKINLIEPAGPPPITPVLDIPLDRRPTIEQETTPSPPQYKSLIELAREATAQRTLSR